MGAGLTIKMKVERGEGLGTLVRRIRRFTRKFCMKSSTVRRRALRGCQRVELIQEQEFLECQIVSSVFIFLYNGSVAFSRYCLTTDTLTFPL